MNILITGADGFIGSELVEKLIKTKHHLYICVNEKTQRKNTKNVVIAHKGRLKDSVFDSLTKKINLVIHCAGLAHNRHSKKFESKYFATNRDLTEKIAISALKNGVKKFIFLSTAGIHSEFNSKGRNITEKKYIKPKNPYTKSKFEAEKLLFKICKNTNMDLIILRPPAVYGNNVKGNLKHLIFFIENKIPLPLGCFNKNKRSYISIQNLIEIILICINYKKKIKSAFLVSNKKSLSTKELVLFLSKDSKNKLIMFNFPIKILHLFSLFFRLEGIFNRLNNSFELDSSSFRKKFNWEEKIDS